jgi:hypothetical protein
LTGKAKIMSRMKLRNSWLVLRSVSFAMKTDDSGELARIIVYTTFRRFIVINCRRIVQVALVWQSLWSMKTIDWLSSTSDTL